MRSDGASTHAGFTSMNYDYDYDQEWYGDEYDDLDSMWYNEHSGEWEYAAPAQAGGGPTNVYCTKTKKTIPVWEVCKYFVHGSCKFAAKDCARKHAVLSAADKELVYKPKPPTADPNKKQMCPNVQQNGRCDDNNCDKFHPKHIQDKKDSAKQNARAAMNTAGRYSPTAAPAEVDPATESTGPTGIQGGGTE